MSHDFAWKHPEFCLHVTVLQQIKALQRVKSADVHCQQHGMVCKGIWVSTKLA